MASGLLAEPVIGKATSGRTRWLGRGMTRSRYCRDSSTENSPLRMRGARFSA
jgi:hypothetical protein